MSRLTVRLTIDVRVNDPQALLRYGRERQLAAWGAAEPTGEVEGDAAGHLGSATEMRRFIEGFQ